MEVGGGGEDRAVSCQKEETTVKEGLYLQGVYSVTRGEGGCAAAQSDSTLF